MRLRCELSSCLGSVREEGREGARLIDGWVSRAGGSGDDGFVPPSARMSERCVESGLAWETESEVVMGDGFSSS